MHFTICFLFPILGLSSAQYWSSPYESELRARDAFVDEEVDWLDLLARDIDLDDVEQQYYIRDEPKSKNQGAREMLTILALMRGTYFDVLTTDDVDAGKMQFGKALAKVCDGTSDDAFKMNKLVASSDMKAKWKDFLKEIEKGLKS